jgi:uncharacterized protein (DUF305 family)
VKTWYYYALGALLTVAIAVGVVLWSNSADPRTAGLAARDAMLATARTMAAETDRVAFTGDADANFAAFLIRHQQGAVALAKTALPYLSDPDVKSFAERLIAEEPTKLASLMSWMTGHEPARSADADAVIALFNTKRASFDEAFTAAQVYQGALADGQFVRLMLPHFQAAVAMADAHLQYGRDLELRNVADDIKLIEDSLVGSMVNWQREQIAHQH